MRRTFLALALAAIALCATPSAAAFTNLLDPLVAAVNAESAKLEGMNDKASKRRKRSLEFIADDLVLERSSSVTDDVGILRAASRPLLKLLGTAWTPLADALTALTLRVRADAGDLAARNLTVVDAKVKSKVDKTAAKALALLDAIDGNRPFAQRIAKVLSAAEAIEAGNKRIDAEAKCPRQNPPGGHHGSLRATIGDREFSSIYQNTSMVYDQGTSNLRRFVLSGTRDIGGTGDTVVIFIEHATFHGLGTYIVDGTNVIVLYEFPKGVFYGLEDGDTVTISSFDSAARDLRGTFTGTFTRGGAPSLVVQDGAFESCNWADSFTQTP